MVLTVYSSGHLHAYSQISPQDSFGVSLSYTHARCPVTAKTAFRLVFMWRSLFRNIHCNRAFQEKLFVEIPFAPRKYWIQWLVLEEYVPLPSVRLPCSDVEKLWGISADLFQDKLQGGHALSCHWAFHVWFSLTCYSVSQRKLKNVTLSSLNGESCIILHWSIMVVSHWFFIMFSASTKTVVRSLFIKLDVKVVCLSGFRKLSGQIKSVMTTLRIMWRNIDKRI